MAGDTLREAAAALGIKEGTARSQLKPVFGKTGTRRQAELVKAVMATPIWMRLQGQVRQIG